MATTFAQAQDTIMVKNSENANKAYYSFREVGSLVLSSRTAFIEDAKELINYYFEDQGIVDDFWQDAAKRYAEWPEKLDNYNPNVIIYVPDNDNVNAIIFEWSKGDLKISLFCTDGLWTTEKSLSKKWRLFINPSFIEIIDFNDVNED